MAEIKQTIKALIPPLTAELHKGQAGRVGILGGSVDYTGAPYFSATSSLRTGADLCHVICEPTAAAVIKTYSPDLMVHPLLRASQSQDKVSTSDVVASVKELLPRIHVLVIGPGLSRDKVLLDATKGVIAEARKIDMPLVLDADGLFLVQNDPDVVKGYKNAVLTPNVMEFKRLCEAVGIKDERPKDSIAEASSETFDAAKKLAKAFGGLTIVQKGKQDIITNGENVLHCDTPGGLKRCGGQGDLLSGSIGTFLAFGTAYQSKVWTHDNKLTHEDIMLHAAYGGCSVVRDASRRAYEQHVRAMQASNMLEHVGPAFKDLYEPKDASRL